MICLNFAYFLIVYKLLSNSESYQLQEYFFVKLFIRMKKLYRKHLFVATFPNLVVGSKSMIFFPNNLQWLFVNLVEVDLNIGKKQFYYYLKSRSM